MRVLNSGKNMHNAFKVVFDTYKSVDKLMKFCTNRAEGKYYIPTNRFLRYSSDNEWEGWVYWSFILLFQREQDGKVEQNDWINAPIYALEINLDPDTCIEPEIILAKFEYEDILSWSSGCSPSNHEIFYNPIHEVKLFESTKIDDVNEIIQVSPKEGMKQNVANKYWTLKRVVKKKYPLINITNENAYEFIFGTFEMLANV